MRNGNSCSSSFWLRYRQVVSRPSKAVVALAIFCVGFTAQAEPLLGAAGIGTHRAPTNLESVTLDPTVVLGGATSTGTVTLNQAAPTAGTVVTLSSDNAAATLPASVTVSGGATTATFTVTTTAVGARTVASIDATLGNRTRRAELLITPLSVQSVGVSPQNVTGGSTSTATVTLNAAAPATGATVNLTSDSTAATVPATVSVTAGSTSATFTVTTTTVTSQTDAKIKATLGNSVGMAVLTISPAVTLGVAVSPTTVAGGAAATGTITLTGTAPTEGLIVTLSSSSASALVEPFIRIKSGATTANFGIKTLGVSASTTATITASVGSASGTASLTITAPTLVSVALDPNGVGGGASTTGVVTLSGPAPEGGLLVSLSSSLTAAKVQSSVKVPGGRTSATFAVATTTVTTQTAVTISATLGSTTQTATLTINPLALSSLAVHPTSVNDGRSATGVVELNSPAPTGGVVVTLSSGNAAVTVPDSVTIAAGHSSATFVIGTGSVTAQTTVTLTATLGTTTETASLVVNPVSLEGIRLNPDRVTGGGTSTGTVSINGPAPAGGLVITLASNSATATVPATVTIPAGQNAVTFAVTTTAVTAKTIVQITATLGTTSKTENLTIAQSPK